MNVTLERRRRDAGGYGLWLVSDRCDPIELKTSNWLEDGARSDRRRERLGELEALASSGDKLPVLSALAAKPPEVGGSFRDSELILWDAQLAEALWEWNEERATFGDPRADVARPDLARRRFAALTAALSGIDGSPANPFGGPADSLDTLVLLARQARDTWVEMLLADTDAPLPLRAEAALDIEAAVDEVLLESSTGATAGPDDRTAGEEIGSLSDGGPSGGGGPLALRAKPRLLVTKTAPRSREHRRVTALGRRSYLPRFRLLHMAAVARSPDSTVGVWLAALVVALLLALTLCSGWWAFIAPQCEWPAASWGWGWMPCILGALAFAVIGYLAVGDRGQLTDALCLRVPASAAIGASTLLALRQWYPKPGPDQVIDNWSIPPVVPVALVAVAFSYLAIEVRNHGVEGAGVIIRRAAGVLGLCVLYAVTVTTLALTVLAPWFAEDFTVSVAALPTGWPRLSMLATASAASLCIGVFLQVLWDDKPITYPLSHLDVRGS